LSKQIEGCAKITTSYAFASFALFSLPIHCFLQSPMVASILNEGSVPVILGIRLRFSCCNETTSRARVEKHLERIAKRDESVGHVGVSSVLTNSNSP
jgi:hypothetical protein